MAQENALLTSITKEELFFLEADRRMKVLGMNSEAQVGQYSIRYFWEIKQQST